jgi:hypothetical protein
MTVSIGIMEASPVQDSRRQAESFSISSFALARRWRLLRSCRYFPGNDAPRSLVLWLRSRGA